LLLQSEEFEYYQFIVPMFGLSLRWLESTSSLWDLWPALD
jgi:hypothetical protein